MRYYILSLLTLFIIPNCFALDFNVNMDEAKTIKAKKIEYNVKSEKIKTTGDTEITNTSGETVKSDNLEYDIKSESLKASGNTELINAAGQRIKSDDLTLTKDKKNIDTKNIELWLGSHVYVQAEKISRKGDITVAKYADFTACEGCDSYGSAWDIHANTVIHNEDAKMLYFHNASFWVYDNNIPIFWLPYYEMPDPSVKYKTGFLSPSLNSTNGMGTQINIPFYINISDRHDLTTTLSYLTNENPLFQAEHRLNLNHSEFRTNASFTRNSESENRWHIFNNDKIELGENARAFVYIERTSDKTYLQKYGFYNYQPYLDSGAKLELFGQSSYVVADTHIFQELREPGRNQTYASGNILPNIRGVYQSDPFYKETYLTLSGDVLAVSGDNADSQRLIGEARIISPWTLWGGNRITLSAASRYDIYNFDKIKVQDNNELYSGVKSRFLPSGYVEWGLPLYSIKNDWTYIIEPRARLTVMQHDDKNSVFALNNDSAGRFLSDNTLFSDNRYSGYDVWENGSFVDYGARWAAFNKNHNIEVFLGQTYDINTSSDKDFNDNGFRNGFSDYVGRIAYSRNYFQIASRFRVDREDFDLSHIENSLYLGKNGNYITLGHIWDTQPIDIYSNEDKDTHEFTAGAGLRLTKRINVRESVVYNAYEHIIQRHSGGIYYEHPCYYFSLEYQRDNAERRDYVGNTTFQFKFGISIDGKHY